MTDGTIEREGDQFTFRYERHLAHPVETVWKAITDPAELEQWMGARVELDLRPGGRLITYHQGDYRVEDRVLEVDPPHLLRHTYFEDVNPTAVVTWRCGEADGGSLLVVTHTLHMDDIRKATESVAAGDGLMTILSRNGAGWHHLLDLIEKRLDGEPAPDWTPEDQQALRERYAALVP